MNIYTVLFDGEDFDVLWTFNNDPTLQEIALQWAEDYWESLELEEVLQLNNIVVIVEEPNTGESKKFSIHLDEFKTVGTLLRISEIA